MESMFAEIGSISFWPKTMDYSKAFCPVPVFVITPHWKVL